MYKVNKSFDVFKLVERFNSKYKEITGANSGKLRTVVKAPEIQSLNKKIYIQNFESVCKSINREPQEVSTYISKELIVPTSISGNGLLVIHGTYRKNQIEDIVKKYVINFVQCLLCKTQDTRIEKVDRVQYIVCNRCHAKNAIL